MPRNSSGTMTLPAPGVPFQSGTAISSAQMNTTLADVATEISDSASRSGKGGFSAPVRVPDGTAAAPAYAFGGEINSGFYRAGPTDVRLAVGGVDALKLVAGGLAELNLPSTAGFGPVVQATGANKSLGLQGNRDAADTAAADVVVGSKNARTAGLLVDVQNPVNVTSRLQVDWQGLLRLASQAGPIQPATMVTAITPGTGLGAAGFFWKDALGMVHVQGGVFQSPSSITNNTLLFTLPAGYRPVGATLRFVSMDGQAASANVFGILVNADGTVTARTMAGGAASITQIDLTMISFLAQQ
jgi:hypothetical protein